MDFRAQVIELLESSKSRLEEQFSSKSDNDVRTMCIAPSRKWDGPALLGHPELDVGTLGSSASTRPAFALVTPNKQYVFIPAITITLSLSNEKLFRKFRVY